MATITTETEIGTASAAARELAQRTCAYIDSHIDERPRLEAIGAAVGVSPFHLQRVFKRVMGITPRQYADARRLGRFKERLQNGGAVVEALYEAGYGSASRLYEHASAQLGMTPAAYRRGGLGTAIDFTIVDCPLGRLLVAATARGVCQVLLGDDDDKMEASLRKEFSLAEIRRVDGNLHPWVEPLLAYLAGHMRELDVPLDIKATAFQRRVWEHLRTIPYGETRSYLDVAKAIGQPTAQRAVAQACAHNPVVLVVPCHRVIRNSGAIGGYAGGVERKRKLLYDEWKAVDDALRAAAGMVPAAG